MACPGGCAGGGGQPIHDGEDHAAQRGQRLYALDQESPIRFSHENPTIQTLYQEYLGHPLSETRPSPAPYRPAQVDAVIPSQQTRQRNWFLCRVCCSLPGAHLAPAV